MKSFKNKQKLGQRAIPWEDKQAWDQFVKVRYIDPK
jgi:hypothetical protein